MGRYELYSIVIPVYAFLSIPAAIAMAGDYKRFLERTAKIQSGLLICVYCLSYAPALLTLKPALREGLPDSGGGAQLLFFFVLIVQLSDALQYAWSHLPSKHVIVPTINTTRTWEGLLGGTASVMLIGVVLCGATPFGAAGWWMAALMSAVDLADGLRRQHHHVGNQARPRRPGLRHAGRRPRRHLGPHRFALLRRPGLLPLHPLVAGGVKEGIRDWGLGIRNQASISNSNPQSLIPYRNTLCGGSSGGCGRVTCVGEG